MASYTLQDLREKGPPFAMAMLLDCLKQGEPFVTYGAIRDELQHQLGVERIFPTQIGWVAGSLMNKILAVDPKAPLINVLVTRTNGLPGDGAGDYLASRYRNANYRAWSRVSSAKKRELIDRERRKILRYKNWDALNRSLFGLDARSKLRQRVSTEADGVPGTAYGGPPESVEHKKLKAWIAKNPSKLGLSKSFGKGIPESPLLSGDTIDVLFSNGTEFLVVEVKSCRSSDEDFRRGVYQCVKYREVKVAEHAPNIVTVQAVLVTERELNEELRARARLLGVKTKCVCVNRRPAR